MFSTDVRDRVAAVARKNGIEPAGLLAVVEVESAGKALEAGDNRTPRFLFERHVFHRELAKRAPNKLDDAIRAGLAIPKWDRKTQYRDMGTSAKRLAVLERAKAIDEECALRSASWGVGQTMGFLCTELGFSTATSMVDYITRGGVPAQVDVMVRFIKTKRLVPKINAHDWAGFAKVYNGPGYAANQYDIKMAAAHRKWLAALDPDEPDTGEEPVELLPTQVAEPAKTGISEGAQVGTGLGITGTAYLIFEKISEVPERAWDVVSGLAEKPSFWFAVAVALVFGFIWWRRRQTKREGLV